MNTTTAALTQPPDASQRLVGAMARIERSHARLRDALMPAQAAEPKGDKAGASGARIRPLRRWQALSGP